MISGVSNVLEAGFVLLMSGGISNIRDDELYCYFFNLVFTLLLLFLIFRSILYYFCWFGLVILFHGFLLFCFSPYMLLYNSLNLTKYNLHIVYQDVPCNKPCPTIQTPCDFSWKCRGLNGFHKSEYHVNISFPFPN